MESVSEKKKTKKQNANVFRFSHFQCERNQMFWVICWIVPANFSFFISIPKYSNEDEVEDKVAIWALRDPSCQSLIYSSSIEEFVADFCFETERHRQFFLGICFYSPTQNRLFPFSSK